MAKEKQTIYIETSIVSAYFDFWGRNPEQSRETKKFWRLLSPEYKPVTSEIAIDELKRAQKDWPMYYLRLIEGVETFAFTNQAAKLVQKYLESSIVPKNKVDDAAHLSVAVINKVDFFLTWNMQHFLRPNKMKQIIDFNQKNKLHLPILVKPSDFLN